MMAFLTKQTNDLQAGPVEIPWNLKKKKKFKDDLQFYYADPVVPFVINNTKICNSILLA